jgi:hypothetical protein
MVLIWAVGQENILIISFMKNIINRIDGMDISKKQISLAKKHINANYICSSITNIPIKNDIYDFRYSI